MSACSSQTVLTFVSRENSAFRLAKNNTTFFSVAMLTYDDNSMSCTNTSNSSVYGTHEHVTYLAQPDFEDNLSPYKTDLDEHEQEILDKTLYVGPPAAFRILSGSEQSAILASNPSRQSE